MPSHPGTPKSAKPELKTLVGTLESDLKTCVRELKLAGDPKTGGALSALEHWTALRGALEKLTSALPAVADVVGEVERDADREFDEAESEFREGCAARGWALNGQWPDFYVEYGVPVSFARETRTANVSGRRTSANAASVMKILEPLVTELVPAKFNDKAFLDALAVACDAASRTGGQTPLLEVYKNMVIQGQAAKFWRDARTNGFKGMSVDQFRARVTRCLLSGVQQDSRGRSLRLFPALNPAEHQTAGNTFGGPRSAGRSSTHSEFRSVTNLHPGLK